MATLKFTEEHEWIRLEGDKAVIGITEYAQSELGDIVLVEVDTIGETLGQGDVFGTIEAAKAVSDLFMPIEGEVLAWNEALEDAPELINQEPYGKGWIAQIAVQDTTALDTLMDESAYNDFIG